MNSSRKPKALCLLGTGSDVGKSVVVAALCRIFKNRGIDVAPYKAQNMSNNSYVTLEGGEMGRAQVVQAEACKIEPHTDMNPVLLKPNSDTGAQVIIHGKALVEMEAQIYHEYKTIAMEAVLVSHERLRRSLGEVFEGRGTSFGLIGDWR